MNNVKEVIKQYYPEEVETVAMTKKDYSRLIDELTYDLDIKNTAKYHCLELEIDSLNKTIETKNKRIKQLEDKNKELIGLIREYKYELNLQELENTSIVDLD